LSIIIGDFIIVFFLAMFSPFVLKNYGAKSED
jgi:hypothetical protein